MDAVIVRSQFRLKSDNRFLFQKAVVPDPVMSVRVLSDDRMFCQQVGRMFRGHGYLINIDCEPVIEFYRPDSPSTS